MVIDTSALVAVLVEEAQAAAIVSAIEGATLRLMSAASLLETAIVIEDRKRDAGRQGLDLFLYHAAIEIAPVDQDQVEIARHAWRRYGKGRHPAALNYGDCFAYALAKQRELPLLYIGNDFARTDVARVLL